MLDYPINETAKKLILEIIKKHPEARGDDRILMLLIWDFQGLKLDSHQQHMFMKVFSPDTIQRSRRKLQEELPSLFEKRDQRLKFAELVKKDIKK